MFNKVTRLDFLKLLMFPQQNMEMRVVCFVSENLGVIHDRQYFDPLIGILHVDEELTKWIIIIYSTRI